MLIRNDVTAGTSPVSASGSLPGFHDVGPILAPKSIAVVGASDEPGAISGVAIHLLQKFRFPGPIWPINPKRTEVHGLPCLPGISALPAPPDLVIFATAAASIPGLVREYAAAGARCGIIFSGGFAETGGDGILLQQQLVAACTETGFVVQGPNCLGTITTALPAPATFASFLLETAELMPGSISMISQSGGTATMAQALAQIAGFGFRTTISSGNEAVLTAADFIHALAADPGTRVIAAYIEGVRDGAQFVAAVREARRAGKPVVLLKGGATATSARAAAAHTGALVGESRVWDAILRDEGVISVGSLEQLIDVACYLASIDAARFPRGPGLAIVAFGGGGGVLSADQAARHGLTTPRLHDATIATLRPLVPPIAAVENPVDLTPQTFNQPRYFANFRQTLDAIAADPGIDSVLFQFGPIGQRGLEIADIICGFREVTAKAVAISWPLAPSGVPQKLREAGVYDFPEYERAIVALAKLFRYGTEPRPAGDARGVVEGFDWSAAIGPVEPGTVISEHACHRVLRQAGLAVAEGELVATAQCAVDAADRVGFPVAMKGISSRVTHRAAAGLVRLQLGSVAAVTGAHAELVAAASAQGVTLEGVYVQRMISEGLELMVSAFRDSLFGPMISIAAGGALTEILDDVVIARAPVGEAELPKLLGRLKIMRVAAASRRPPDIATLSRYVALFSRLAATAPWQRFILELNPVKWSAQAAIAVDGLLIIETP